MARSAETAAREAKIAELKRLIAEAKTLGKAVDTFLRSEQDRLTAEMAQSVQGYIRYRQTPYPRLGPTPSQGG